MSKFILLNSIICLYCISLFSSCGLVKVENKSNTDLVSAGLAIASANSRSSVNSTYPSSTAFTFTAGQSITLTPSQHVSGSSYSVSPALPSGLSLNASTGVLSGTPTSAIALTTFTITQTKPDGSIVTFSISMEVTGSTTAGTTTTTTTVTNQTVGGTITGNLNGGTVVFRLNGANNLSRNALGSFTFGTTLTTNTAYTVTIFTQPAAATSSCGITSNGSGTIASANVTNVVADCNVCGNGITTSYQCDDNNTTNGDGCSSSCAVEGGWTCSGSPSVCI